MFNQIKILLLVVLGLIIVNHSEAQTIKQDTITHQFDNFGGEYIHINQPETPLHYFVYKFKPSKKNELKSVYANEYIPDFFRNTINQVSKRETNSKTKVVAAINGDFFSYKSGELEGFQVTNGEVVYAHVDKIKYGVNIDKKNGVYLDSVYFEGNLKTWKHTYSLTGVNTLQYRDSLQSIVLLDSHINFDSIQPKNYKLVLLEKKGKKFQYKSIVSEVPESIKSNQYLLAINIPNSEAIITEIQSRKVKLDLSLKSKATNKKVKVAQHISGGVPLLVDGKIPQISVNMYGTYRGKKHPRTALGINKKDNTVVFLVVDGRSDISVGANYETLSKLFLENGCTDAVNLDGGGSSALWLDGEIKNIPSDKTGTRPCLNYLLFSI